MTDPKLTRLNVNLNQETADALRDLADLEGRTFTEMVRRCISVYKFVSDEQEAGRVVLTATPKGRKMRELVLR